ncbi:DUF2782 domain-containing protein [Aquitalea sp. FJL05]|uniref:DUF2782 domain-containing protein n=1 Tax=Aquitalea TaxID=407217 RepID=UPI000F591CE6|nr:MULTISPECIES: DUF2782 domain-containing protein [Aquitalea]RQO69251.1 DUF2782 domain-containing protein [Aquitalea sp. FJL05]
MRRFLALLALLPLSAAWAATPAPATIPPPPTISQDAAGTAEPEVRIIQRGDDKIEEYRLNGQLYMMKVTPSIGFPYYLMDEEGNGSMKQVDPNRRIIIPQWVLKRF